MKNPFKKFSVALLVIVLLSVSYAGKAFDFINYTTETEEAMTLENWMVDESNFTAYVYTAEVEEAMVLESWMTNEFYWQVENEVKKGKPMLAITPNGDTVTVYIDEVVKAKDTTIVNEYNTYNTYNNYDGWKFFYNDAWMLSSIWYHNYYHAYYPMVYSHRFHSYDMINNYYKKHHVVFIEKPHNNKHVNTYERPRGNPYGSKYNSNYYNKKRDDVRFKNEEHNKYTPKFDNQRRSTEVKRYTAPNNSNIQRGRSNSPQNNRPHPQQQHQNRR